LPQALQARRQTLRDVLAQLERQQARLLDLYLAEVIEREEFERRRKEVTQTQQGLRQQLRQLDAQAQQHVNVVALAQGIETFCQRLYPTLDNLTFAQRRQLVELLIDCVIVNDAQVEIRYVVPTGPKGETTPFCHLRLDYLDLETRPIQLHQFAAVEDQIRGSQHDVARLGWGFPVDNHHEAQLAFESDMPDDGRIQMQMIHLRQRAEGLKAAEVLKIDFALILTPRPTALWVRAGVKKPTVGVAPQLGNRMQGETDRFIQVFLLGKVPVHAMIGDLRR
jgi:hypothetical protein